MSFSVRFFKRLFLCVLVILFLIPVGASIWLGISANRAELRAAELEERLVACRTVAADAADRMSDEPASPAAPLVWESDLPYQQLYPDLYCDSFEPACWVREEKVAYLTFDDGSSANTDRILDILAQYDIKATFFVTGYGGEGSGEWFRKIVNAGHTIGIHSYSHNYKEIYGSVEAYLDDFYQMYRLIYDETGVKPQIFRFPGGSVNYYNSAIYQALIAEMTRRGFTYYDWNVSGEDATMGANAEKVKRSVLDGVEGTYRAVILLHDAASKGYTVEALPDMIEGIKAQGFQFAQLTAQVQPVVFGYQN